MIDLRNLPLSEKQIQYTLTGPTDQVVSCAISPGGRTALTASYDGTARIWDLATGSCRHTLTGPTDQVVSLCDQP